ncbi:hypothetical protein [Prochlorothrix hollandica]|uniref:Uncharacterized protein n=1 Tax=Prochlorothrix hollandica PCC 9006 = CALU 1027 TaxID=317619 RepID=A0A0M2Q0V6_PROHO|nr:hypothetical protein [Prochlorothrix hollandica]KKJ00277.1 hypothetical protein PROH_11365 [Prochlorothrix hollandica PCC 9006 = CALU 1027]
MSYSDFSLSSVKKAFQLHLIEQIDLFMSTPDLNPSPFLTAILKDNLPIALASNTEKSRSEMIIAPILIDLRKQLENHISIFSGINFTVDASQGLNGNCDFLISYSQELMLLTAPIITLVEAKKEDLNSGLGQCIAEMIAAQRFNQQEGNNISEIYGVITSGTIWKFLKLVENQVFLDLTEHYLINLPKILGILSIPIRTIESEH